MKINEVIILRNRMNPFKTQLVQAFNADWGDKEFGKAEFFVREKKEIQYFDIKEFVKVRKRSKMGMDDKNPGFGGGTPSFSSLMGGGMPGGNGMPKIPTFEEFMAARNGQKKEASSPTAVPQKPSNFNNKTNQCKYKNNCTLQNICNSNCHAECRRCGKCNEVCSKYELDICVKLIKPPYVCNACTSYAQCRKIKYIYVANEAQKRYEATRTSSREGINISAEELRKLDNLITPLIKQGQSIKLIYSTHKEEINCSVRCLYNYIEMGVLSVKNIDLPRKVRYKVK